MITTKNLQNKWKNYDLEEDKEKDLHNKFYFMLLLFIQLLLAI